MISAWRMSKSKHRQSAFSGDGARLFGGRWNSKGTAMVYTAGSISLAVLEMLVHLDSHTVLPHYLLAEICFDESLVERIAIDELPKGWNQSPPPCELRAIGDGWIVECRSAILQVPSAVVSSECNYLVNPIHPDFARIEIHDARPCAIDPHLVR